MRPIFPDAAEAILERLLTKEICFSLAQLAVNGRDLLALGLQGRAIGQTLDALLARVAEGELPNEKEILLDWIEKTRDR